MLALLSMIAMQMTPPPPTVELPVDVQDAIRRREPGKAVGKGPVFVNLGEVFNSDNYPFWALQNWDEGSVRFGLDVDSTGKPTQCRIVQPSGVPSLDQPTCDLLLAKARFLPATDRRGRPVAGSYSRVIKWVTDQIEPWRVADRSQRLILWVDASDKRQCRMEDSPGDDNDPRTCANYVDSPMVAIMLARQLAEYDGSREHWELVWHHGWFVPGGPAGEGATIGSRPGETLFERTRARLTIDAAGKVTDCMPIELGSASDAEWIESCASMRKARFEPAARADAKVRVLVQVSATYVREK